MSFFSHTGHLPPNQEGCLLFAPSFRMVGTAVSYFHRNIVGRGGGGEKEEGSSLPPAPSSPECPAPNISLVIIPWSEAKIQQVPDNTRSRAKVPKKNKALLERATENGSAVTDQDQWNFAPFFSHFRFPVEFKATTAQRHTQTCNTHNITRKSTFPLIEHQPREGGERGHPTVCSRPPRQFTAPEQKKHRHPLLTQR